MKINIMNQYVELTKKQINFYIKSVFENKYNKEYCNLFIEKYINVRYYDFYEFDIEINTTRKKVIEQLKRTQEDIIYNNISDKELIEQMRVFFYYVLYFDNVLYYKNLKNIIGKIAKLKKRILNKENVEFEDLLYNKMKEFEKEKNDLIEKFESEKFYLKISNYPEKINIFRVNLKYNINFPPLYSEFAIEKAFNTGIINEDKLEIEYYLTVIQILKDLIKQNFKKIYIVEFASSLLEKSKKLKGLLNIIDNSGIKDKICLKIKYEDFNKKKEDIYNLMREGYRFAIIIDNSFEVDYKNIQCLEMFKYIILNKQLDFYEEFKKNKLNLENVIEI